MSGEHQHTWRRVAHIDGCHWFTNVDECECGETRETTLERSPHGYGALLMHPENCEECRRILAVEVVS